MAEIIDKTTKLYGSQQRLYNFPLVVDGQFNTFKELDDYLKSNTTAYPGQIISVIEEETIYLIVPETKNSEKLIPKRTTISFKDLENLNNKLAIINNSITELNKKIDSSVTDLNERIDNIVITGGETEKIPNETIEDIFEEILDREFPDRPAEEYEAIPNEKLDELFEEVLGEDIPSKPSEEYTAISTETLDELFNSFLI